MLIHLHKALFSCLFLINTLLPTTSFPFAYFAVVEWSQPCWISRCDKRSNLRTEPPGSDEVNWCFWTKFLIPAAATHQTDGDNETETKVKKNLKPLLYIYLCLYLISFRHSLCSLRTIVYYSNKDEELLKTYKNVYSKLLRAEKNAPLLSRLGLYIELLQQLTPQTGSDDTSTHSW